MMKKCLTCWKTEEEVKVLIVLQPSLKLDDPSLAICLCNECVALCQDMVEEANEN